jgi:hypothetical protein
MSAWWRRVDQPRVQLGAFLLLAVGVAALDYHLTRGSSFLFDDWSFVLDRRGGSIATYLAPHNQHFSLLPVAIYKFLFATFGIGSYAPYRIVLIACNLLLYGLVYAYARRRIGAWAALVASALLALLGPGWEDMLWPFQIGFVLSLCGGVGALLALGRRTRRSDALAAVLTFASLASSGIGIPVAIGIVVDVGIEIVRKRRPLSDAWIVGIPLALFAAWWVGYQTGGSGLGALDKASGFIEKEAAAVMASLFGRAGPVKLDGAGTITSWGTPLLIASALLLVWRIARGAPISPRVLAPAVMLVVFWAATAATRTTLVGNPFASRYIFVGSTFALLIAAELARGWHPGPIVVAALAAIAGIAIVSNIGELRTAGGLVRGFGQDTVADLGALEIGRPLVPASYVAHGLPGYPLILLGARNFFTIAAELGNPAAGVPQIEAGAENAKEIADSELVGIHGLKPVALLGAPARRSCQTAVHVRSVRVVKGTLVIQGPVHLSVRRFAALPQPIGVVSAGESAELRIAPDRSSVSWQVLLSASGRVTVCGL